AAAESIGVARQTVSEWFNHNEQFRDALFRRRQELWAEQAQRMRGLLNTALDVIEKQLKEGDTKAAWDILRMSRLDETAWRGAPLPVGERRGWSDEDVEALNTVWGTHDERRYP
ncbi:MAG TPA: hypothetical protein VNN73_11415, partial [Blastocatellia bacterium]|nr:hypothetical protein [Blastocatellia bacterium]